MKTETQPEQPVLSDDVARPEDAVAHPTDRRLAYKTMLDAVIIGILTISALWLFVMRLEESPVVEALVTESDKSMYEDTSTQPSPAVKTAPAGQAYPQWVRSRRVTLNHDAGALAKLTDGHGEAPTLMRRRGDELSKLSASDL